MARLQLNLTFTRREDLLLIQRAALLDGRPPAEFARLAAIVVAQERLDARRDRQVEGQLAGASGE